MTFDGTHGSASRVRREEMYGTTQRALREMKNLLDTLFEYRQDEQTRDDLKGELDRFMEVDKRNWSMELRDLANSIIEIIMDETD